MKNDKNLEDFLKKLREELGSSSTGKLSGLEIHVLHSLDKAGHDLKEIMGIVVSVMLRQSRVLESIDEKLSKIVPACQCDCAIDGDDDEEDEVLI